jgi:hypothetical protein
VPLFLEEIVNNGVIPMGKKADYVRKQQQTRWHTCHWPECEIQVPPAMWGCKEHWFMLPKQLRDQVWAAYVIGQEVSMTPSNEYLEIAHEVQEWIRENHLS